VKSPEELIARLLNYLAEKYKNQLILKGGILLRLLNSPRSTQDLDYSWIRTKKRDVFAKELKTSLEMLEGIQVTDIRANSRGVFLDIRDSTSGNQATIEISVEKSLNRPPQSLTSAVLSNLYSLKPQIIATMDLSEALSNKIAAALERDLARDFYDLMQLEPMTAFDEATLRDRLSRLEIGRSKARKIRPSDASKMLRTKLDALNEENLREELSAFLPKEQLVGLFQIIRASVGRLIQRMEVLTD